MGAVQAAGGAPTRHHRGIANRLAHAPSFAFARTRPHCPRRALARPRCPSFELVHPHCPPFELVHPHCRRNSNCDNNFRFLPPLRSEVHFSDVYFRLLQSALFQSPICANYFRLLRFACYHFQFPVNYLRLLQPAQSNFLFRDNYLRFPLLCNLMLRPGSRREHPQTRNSGQLSIIFCTRDLWRAPRTGPKAPQRAPRSPPALRNRSKRK